MPAKVLTFLGREFELETDLSDDEFQEIVNYVEKLYNELKEKTQTVSTIDLSIMASVIIAEELFKVRKELEGIEAEVDKKIMDIVELIENILQEVRGERVYGMGKNNI